MLMLVGTYCRQSHGLGAEEYYLGYQNESFHRTSPNHCEQVCLHQLQLLADATQIQPRSSAPRCTKHSRSGRSLAAA